ncbi:DUF2169 family type VI secretion system accessory protein [Sorangium sp. So ce233]|uniref:DUF2169 family type VI secretion system accessory protein n=1 Tax=Sorangium sp. So ce233 TaxID=3133290 RepID=UPI003F61E017
MRTLWPLPVVALTPASCGAVRWRMQGAERLTVIVKATFALVPDRSAELAAPAELVCSDRLRDGRGSLEEACETAPYLPSAGVLVRGHAAAPAGTTATALSVRVALFREDRWVLDKVLHVHGDWTREAPIPRPFSLMPLVYERAYGGPHIDANPVGVGAGAALPNIVDPADPARPAGFGPIARHWAPRSSLIARDRSIEPSAPELDGSFDFRYFHAAPADQQIEFLRGDEWIFLQGLHPRCPWIRSSLPSARGLARLYRTGAGGEEHAQPIELVADTLTIDADRLLCSVIWRGNVALLPDDVPARMRVVAGVEMPGWPLLWPSAAAPAPPPSSTSAPGPPPSAPAPGPPPSRPAPGLTGDEPAAENDTRAAIKGEPAAEAGHGGLALGVARPLAPVVIADAASAPVDRGVEIPAGHWSVVTQQVTRLHVIPALPFVQRQEPRLEPEEPHWSVVTQQVPQLHAIPALPFVQRQEPHLEPQEPHWSAVTQQATPLAPAPPLPFLPAPEPPPRPEPPPGSVPFAMPFARAGTDASSSEPLPPVLPPLAGLDETHPVIQPPAPVPPPPAVLDDTGAAAQQPPATVPPPPAPLEDTNPAVDGPRSLAAERLVPATAIPAPASAATPADAPPTDAPPTDAPPADAALAGAASSPAAAPEPPSPEPEARGLRAEVIARLKSGQPLHDLELAGADLEGIDWSGASLERVNLAGATLARCNFASARLARANLSGADLTAARLDAADLTRADLSRATLDDAQLSSAILDGADLTSARGANARFDGASLDGADLRRARLTEALFDRASLAGVNGSQADIPRSSFARANLAGAILRAAKLKEARLTGANVDGADLREADLTGANVHGVNLANAKSGGAILRSLVETPPPDDEFNVSSQR